MFSKCVLNILQPQMIIVISVNNRILQNNSICLVLFCMGIIMAYTKDSKSFLQRSFKKFQLWLKVFRVVMVIIQTVLVWRNWLRQERVIGPLAGYLDKQWRQQLFRGWNEPLLWFCFPFWVKITPEKLLVFGTRAISHNRFVAKKDTKPFLVPNFGIFLYKRYSSCACSNKKRNDLIVSINSTVVESVKKKLQTPCSDIASSKKMNKQLWGVE